jgi:hypothetical protein
MSRQGASWDDYYQDQEHKARRISKLQRIQGLRDLHDTYEKVQISAGLTEKQYQEMLKVRARLRAAQNQLEAMAV